MLDRESTFAQPELIRLLKTDFIPVAIDQANQRRQTDTEGEFYQKIAGQGPLKDFKKTTQGFYVATAAGKLMLYNNNRDPEKVLRLVKESLAKFQRDASALNVAPLVAKSVDRRYTHTATEGQLIVRVQAKILGGYKPTTDRWERLFQTALSRDNLWITKQEHKQLVGGEFPQTLSDRIARFHLVDNTRGEPLMWRQEEVQLAKIDLANNRLNGKFTMSTASDVAFPRTYDCQLKGHIEVQDGKVVRFDAVALGQCSGEGRYTRGAPEGQFPLAISFTLADGSDTADQLPPQGARGWIDGYFDQ